MPPLLSASRPLGKTAVQAPAIIFGTSALGNLYQVVPAETKLALLSEIFRHSAGTVTLDCAGKYGAGLALESVGTGLRQLNISADQVVISNKLGWYRTPLRGADPTFERDVWFGLKHDAEQRVSYEGILACHAQGDALLGPGYSAQVVSVHDPDEYLAKAKTPADRRERIEQILGAYRALFELKAQNVVRAVGIGCKDWRVIREISEHVDLDWVMFACSLTVYSHPPELLEFIAELFDRRVGMINSAVFHAGFLTGGPWFDYRRADPLKDAGLFHWRETFFRVCQRFAVSPAHACVQFGFAVPGVISVALNTEKPERIQANLASVQGKIPHEFWLAMKDEGLLRRDFAYLG